MSLVRLLSVAASLGIGPATAAAPPPSGPVRNVVLVHGALADGSGWQPVADILVRDGYAVSVVQQPETSLEEDVAATNRILDRLSGRAVLVGHSYAGAIITEAGWNSHVASLVYVAAFVPDEGEQLGTLSASMPSAAHSLAPTADGYLLIDPAGYPADFAPDLPPALSRFMAISQVPVNSKIFATPIAAPAWRTKPTYGIVATQDRMINPELERSLYRRAHAIVTEIQSSHVVFLTHPREVADIIEKAAVASR